MAIKDLGGERLARSAVNNAAHTAHPKWYPYSSVVPLENYGYDVQRGLRVQRIVEQSTPIVWALDLFAAVIPAILLLLLVRWAADRFLPGYGTAAAITLGLATVVMTFAAEYFSHVISAGIAFAAFCVLMKERDGPPRWGMVAIAGLLAGLAVTFEFQTGLVGVVLFGYALSRKTGRADARPRITDWLRRGDGVRRRHRGGRAAHAGLQLLGVRQSAEARLRRRGRLPRRDRTRRARPQQPRVLRHHRAALRQRRQPAARRTGPAGPHADHRHGDRRGLQMRRQGHRAEANTILAVAAVYFIYNSGYWLPFGGGTPGPRFLIPALPFVAIGLAFAYKRLPALTLGLAIPSALMMVVGSLTYPLLGKQGTGTWADWLVQGRLEHTVLTAFGVTNAWLAVAPMLAALLTAVVLAVRATPSTALSDYRFAVPALLTWACVSAVGPGIAGDDISVLNPGNSSALWLVASGLVLSLAVLSVVRARERRAQPGPEVPAAREGALGPELAFDEPTS